MKFYNCALVHDELLLDIVKVLEQGWPAGPTFLNSLGSLVEACVIHDKVYFDPLNHTSSNESDGETISGILITSSFIQDLITSEAISPLPHQKSIDEHFTRNQIEYKMFDFALDVLWQGISFSMANPEDELSQYEVLTELMRLPQIFEEEDLTIRQPNESVIELNPAFFYSRILRLSREDLKFVEACNRRAKGYIELAKHLGVSLYPTCVALPHQIGAVRSSNSRARQLYQSIIEHVTKDDEADKDISATEIGENGFSRVPIPPFCQIVLEQSRGAMNSIPSLVAELRHKHRNFRKYLTDYEQAWDLIRTREERSKLLSEFQNAWQTLIEEKKRPSTRIIYKIWRVLKNPLNTLEEIGDLIAARGNELSVIDRVNGLHDFYKNLASSPIPKLNRELINTTFPKIAEERAWSLAEQLAIKMNSIQIHGAPRIK